MFQITQKIKVKSNTLVFVCAGICYVFIEVCVTSLNSRMATEFGTNFFSLMGFSSIYMFFLGGVSGLILGLLNEIGILRNYLNLFFHSLIGCLIVTLFEFLTGLVLNVWFKFGLWDYSSHLVNLMGQISLRKSLTWLCLAPLIFWFDDQIRAVVYGEGKIYSLLRFCLGIFKFKLSMNELINEITD